MFHFQHFSARHDRCAVKVGTDALLLGGWTDFHGARTILDIGTGCGVLALIAAQRNGEARIDAVEMDDAAAEQAVENFAASPWPDRLRVHRVDVRRMKTDARYDLIISNPPFYAGESASPDERQGLARHGGELTFTELMDAIARLLAPDGRCALIIPANREAELLAEAAKKQTLLPARRCLVHYLAGRPPKRVMLELRRKAAGFVPEEITVQEGQPPTFTAAYRELLRDLVVKL